MLVARERVERLDATSPLDTMSLPYDRRQHSRQRSCLDDGEQIALMLPRGTVLREGDILRCEGGRLVRVRAAPEHVSRITSKNPLQLTRAAYHLGNRHVPTQLGAGYLAYAHDHVLDEMIERLGLHVTVVRAPFEPEPGAYGHSAMLSHGTGHDDAHGPHGHEHGHSSAPHVHPPVIAEGDCADATLSGGRGRSGAASA
jgi:urease accessory protein